MPIQLTRRQTLQSLATAAAFASGIGGTIFGLAGCGGAGGGEEGSSNRTGLRARAISVSVGLPSGNAVPGVSSLKVWSSAGIDSPGADGKAKVTVFNDGPQYAEARDTQGRLVVSGFVGQGRTTLDATSTAELLAYFALGAGALASEGRVAVLGGVKTLNGFQAIVDAVTSQIATRGTVTRDGVVLDAIEMFVAANPRSLSRKVSSRGTLVEPDAEASGVILDTLVDGELKLTNNYLRRGHAWLERTGYKSKDGQEHVGLLEIEQFDLAVPSRYGGFTSAIGDIIAGNYVWSPVTMPTKGIPLAPADALETYYKLTVVGIGGTLGDYPLLSQERQDVRNTVAFKALFFDLLLPVISNILLPLKGDEFDEFVDHCDANTVMSDAINLLRQTVPEALGLMNAGEYAAAASTVWKAAWTTNSMLPVLSATFLSFVRDRVLGSMSYEMAADRFKNAIGIFGAVDLTASCFDVGLLIHDWANSNHADIFKITSRGGKITVIPDQTSANPDQAVNVRVVIQDKNPAAVYKYEWSVSAGYRLTAGDGKTTDTAPGGVLVSNFDAVALASKEDKDGTATVTCTVTRIDGTPDVRVDSKTAAVVFEKDEVLVVPARIVVGGDISGGGNVNFFGDIAAFIEVPVLGGHHQYTLVGEYREGTPVGNGASPYNDSWATSSPDQNIMLSQARFAGMTPPAGVRWRYLATASVNPPAGQSQNRELTEQLMNAKIAEMRAIYAGAKVTVTAVKTPAP